MPNKVLITPPDGTPEQLCFADHAGDFLPSAANDLRTSTPTTVQMALASLASGSYYQSAEFDLGADFAEAYAIRCAFELASAPTAGALITLYAGFWHATGVGEPAGMSGIAGPYTGYASNAADSVKQLVLVGSFVCTAQATATVQVGEAHGMMYPRARYGALVLLNGSGIGFHADDVESHIVATPIIVEIQ